jgi:hypothetical protein
VTFTPLRAQNICVKVLEVVDEPPGENQYAKLKGGCIKLKVNALLSVELYAKKSRALYLN